MPTGARDVAEYLGMRYVLAAFHVFGATVAPLASALATALAPETRARAIDRCRRNPDRRGDGGREAAARIDLIAEVRCVADQLIRWAKATIIPSGPRTYAMRHICSY
jgi:hypothetical protein